MAEVHDSKHIKHKDKELSEKKEIAGAKKESESKDEDTDKSKRHASHLIAFFSQSKSSKHKDKEKENTKEKEKEKSKSKDKDKGRSTPPPEKLVSEGKSTHGGKLERKGSTGSTASQKSEGKSWRKSLGILGGSKHDKEDKHKKNTDHRASTPADLSIKNSLGVTVKQEENAVKTKESKEDKSNKKQTERRSSTPTAELLKKNVQALPSKQDSDALKTVKENKEEKSNKKQPERRSSTPTAELQTKNSHEASAKEKTLKEDKVEKSPIKKQNGRRSLNPTGESHTKNSQAEPLHKTVKEEKEKVSHKSEPNSQTRVKTNDNGLLSSENAVQLREKKGRSTSDERREKARSLGDLSSQLHKVEVSILDPTVPPSRTVDTMDIPDQLAPTAKRPMSSNAVLESAALASKIKPLERKSVDVGGVYGTNTFKEHSDNKSDSDALKNSSAVPEASLNGNSTKPEAVMENKPKPSVGGSGSEERPAPGPALEKKSVASDQETSKVTSPAKNSRSGSGSSFMTDISELSAELSAAIASPPPQPIRLSMSESNLLSTGPPPGNRRSPVGKDHGKGRIPLLT